ncbi:centromere-associated protein E isoform X2 [Zonotrichia leucophrys gambelii]|uniref:centromere-associated protein E isoform X2 n=1 Tax=Zonotrichia leucophrys gambelii TaxID=257770 RepID=UPI003140A07F
MADEGAVTVCVRVRPLISRENASDKVSLHWTSENNTVSDVSGTKTFSYDRVFHSSDNTQQLYDGVAVPIIQSAVRGYNGTIFAYGQTASGKTYTMMGNEDSVGIIPKAIQHVFKIICEIPDREFLLRVSYMEIYNETITDLLCDNRKKKPLGIREDVNRNTYVEDLIEEVVVAPEQVMEWIRKGERNRHYGETKMNEHSSRSHTIFRMIIESRERSDPANANCDGAVMVSHLNLVDLAGSERASQTGSEGVRLKEGCNINRSLFILGQVIKKLCDDPSGFINYRDSKLTRILQNSLGGNAKTVIICTITPVSFDETLSTLQFANTAKGMKNTPKVNEVLDDDALLKRYRKEILDLKKQLEEVSSKTQIHAMEKDQLAQLLEEKNSLQKVQEDRIRNLTEMLVTSASFASKEKVKAKRRRRVTWAPGKINQANVSFFEDFENAMPTETKKMKLSLPAVPDVEDSALENSGYDSHFLMVPDQISEEAWIAGPNMNWTQKDFEESVQLCEELALEKDIAVNKVNVLQANFDNLVQENEQLKSEINELKERLKEKTEIDEFEALEKQTQKDHEAEINSKLEQLKEKENKIKTLQNRVEELQKAEVERKETSFALGDCDKLTEKIQQLNKSLLDSETIALDAKKESAFLRSENLELKEKMNELLNDHNQMQKDVQLYQSQIEAGKASYRKMQADLQRELQSLFQENTRLTSLMEGKVPKDLLSHVELEKKAADLKGELENALKENALLQKQVNELSEFQSLPNTVEIQKKEIVEKCEELRLLKLENEKLLSEVADNEMRLKHMSEEIEKSKDNLTDVQLKYTKCDEEYVALKQLHEEIEQKYTAASETNEQMKLQIECLSKEAQESKTILDEVKLELSSKMKELEEKEAEQKQLLELRESLVQTQQKLNELEQLKEKERISEVRLEAKDLEIQAVLQQLTECQEEIKTLTQERDDLKQKEEFLQAETEQLREDIKDTVSMNILAHEDLRNTQNSLKESQKTVKKLEQTLSEKESQILSVEEALGKTIKELQIQISEMTEEMKIITSERDQLQVQKEQIIFLTQENRSLQEKLDSLLLKTEECGEGTWIPQTQGQSVEQELLLLREELSQAQQKLHEMEEAKASEYQGEPEKMERTDVIPKPHDSQEVSIQTERDDDEFKMQLENLQHERDQLREMLQETISKNSEIQEELRCTCECLAQQQEKIVELKGSISEKENQLSKVQGALEEKTDKLQQKLTEVTENLTRVSAEYGDLVAEKQQTERAMSEQLERITSLSKEKDQLQHLVETCKEREEHLLQVQRQSETLKDSLTNKISEMTEEMKIITSERDQLQVQKEQIIFLTQENRSLQEKLDSLLLKTEECGEGTWIPQTQGQSVEQELLLLREELSQAQQKLHEMEEAKASEYQGEPEKMERTDVIPKPHDSQEVSIQTERDDDEFKMQLENLQHERDQLREMLQETISKNSEIQEELRCTRECLAQQQEKIVELKGSISEKENQLSKVQGALEEKTDKLQQKLTEVTENLTRVSAEYGDLVAEKQQTERAMSEQLERITSLSKEKDQLQHLVETCKEREEHLLQVQRQSETLKDSLTNKLTEVTENLTRVSAEYGDLVAEKQQTERAMSEQLERITSLSKEKDQLQHLVETCKEREEHLLQVQRQSETLKDSLTNKIQQLTETLNSVSCEKDLLLAERTNHSLQLKEQISSVNQEKDELQKLLQDVRSERDQLKTELQKNSEMCVETKAKLEDALEQMKLRNLNNMSIQVNPVDIAEQVANDSLTDKTLKIKELLEKFPSMGKRYECLSTVSLKLKSELNSQRALLAVILPQLPLEQSKQVKMLQTKNEDINTRLQKLLTKLKLLFSSVCTKRREYHTTVHKYEMELLEEKRKQDHLQSQIQCLRKINLKQNEVSSQELNSCEGLQSFYLDAESILKDVSEMENELLCIEAELDQEASARKETIQFWEVCSETHWDTEELKEELKKDNERLLQIFQFWTPKVKMLLELSSELDARTADYSKNADVELKQRKEKNEELLQDLNTLKEKLAPGGSASLALEEENYRLHNKLKAAEQDKKAMEVKIQKLENVINEVGESIKERDDRISKLQAQMRIRTKTSELTQLQAKLNEMDNCLRTALTEKQSLQAKLDEGAELYKEEIDRLKTQLVKCDLERMKQSNSFERKLANYEALAEHQEQQLTKLKEELRRAYQEQDVTVLKEADPQQPQKPLTCGGGSGIVQSTQILVLKSEQAKLQKENLQLKKQNDLLLSEELQLKEEVRKWKERALKWREKSSRETTRETIPKSPKKTVSYFFKEQTPSPCKETVSQETVTQDLPKPLNPTRPTNFFDNSNLGVLTDTRPEGRESTEEHLRHFFGTPGRDKAPDCKTQ